MKEFSTRAMHDLLKSQGDKRVSEDAAEELGGILETFAGDVAEEAKVQAEKQGRVTVKQEDIRKALY
jgi:histone H3/H4